MSEEQIDFIVNLLGREPIPFTSGLGNPVLQQLCWAIANRDQLGSQLMCLELKDAAIPFVYFPVSSLVSIDSSHPLPSNLFEGANAANAEDYLHLDMDRSWIEWAIRNLERGADKLSTYQTMRNAGVDHDAICTLLDYTPEDADGPIELPERETIEPLTGPESLQAFRIHSDYLEMYLVPEFLDSQLCKEFIAAIGDSATRSKVHKRDAYYEGRTSDTRFFPNHDQPMAIVRNLQGKTAGMLDIDEKCLEPLHGNIYKEGQQFRAHTDYFKDRTVPFVSQDGVKRFGERQWSSAIYLNAIERGSGIRFPRLGMEFDPEPGSAVIWNNLYPSGNPNPYSLHEGLRVRSGTKYMLAQFSRALGNEPEMDKGK